MTAPDAAPSPTPLLALYAGSFDPITNGHVDLIERTLTFADRLIVAVANNMNKQPLFSVDERVAFIREITDGDPRIEVRAFSGLLVNFAKEVGARVNVRGLRAVSDFEYEFQIALMNRHLHPGLETVFMTPSLDTTYISSSMVREVAKFGGEVAGLVHPSVATALVQKFADSRASVARDVVARAAARADAHAGAHADAHVDAKAEVLAAAPGVAAHRR